MKQNKIISVNYKIEFEFIPQCLKVECSLCVSLVLTWARQKKKESGSLSDVHWLGSLSRKLMLYLSLQCRREKAEAV